MFDFLSSVGKLAVDVGSGWISRYEAGLLAQGDVVRAEEEAGRAQRVSLNGEYLCDASIVVAGDRFFAKVERLEPESPPEPLPERGDEATELLPFAIRIGSIDVSLGELSGVGALSFIDLDKAFGEADDAELIVAGIVFAAGKAVVIGENFGIRITRRLADRFEEKEPRTSGALLFLGYGVEPVKDYDFRMPDCFTRRGIQKAQDLHVGFLRTLASRLPATGNFKIKRIDQLAYHEWSGELPASGRSYALLGTAPPRERSNEGRCLPPKLVLRPASAKGELPPSIAEGLTSYAERCLRPSGARPVIVSLSGSMQKLLEEDPGLALTASCLRSGWKRVADLRVAPASEVGERVPGDEAAYPSEMILYVRIEDPSSADGGLLELIYPLRSLEACFTALNA